MRVFNWDTKLVQFAEEVRGQPYEWGETDCASIVLRALNVMYEGSHEDSLPSWTTKTGAKRALTKLEGVRGGLSILGASRASQSFKQSGDIVVRYDDDFPALGVIVRTQVLSSTHDRGVYLEPVTEFGHEEAYRV